MSTTIRRRTTEAGGRLETRRQAGEQQIRLFLPRNHAELLQALAGSALAIDRKMAMSIPSTIARQEHQDTVFGKIGRFLVHELERLQEDPGHEAEFSRVILPPRTGKTVIMGEVIATTGVASLILVPDLVLASRHRERLAEQLPTARIGLYTGEEKAPEPYGITIATYQTMIRAYARGTLPPWLRHVPFVFADEAHQSMTPQRMPMLREAFDPATIRMAFTATPDYSGDPERTLGTYFPFLIHEMPVSEAFESKLLAPATSSVYEVDVDASEVAIRAGEYDEATLSRLMDSAPVFQKALELRYASGNIPLGALMTCSGVEQAEDLKLFLSARKPKSSPEPEVIIGTTNSAVRESALAQFDAEPGHTLIVVGSLIQGWDSKRCKVLVDIAPSVSLVRSKQKYFRPLTKDAEAQAQLYVLIPLGLKRDPILPNDVFGKSVEQTRVNLSRTPLGRPARKLVRQAFPKGQDLLSPVGKVKAVSTTIIEDAQVPTLIPNRDQDVRKVITSGFRILRVIPEYREFQRGIFKHDLFSGTGKHLLRYLGVMNQDQYTTLMQRLFPEQAANSLLKVSVDEDSSEESLVRELALMYEPGQDGLSPEDQLLEKERIELVRSALELLDPEVSIRARYFTDAYVNELTQRGITEHLKLTPAGQDKVHENLKKYVRNYLITQGWVESKKQQKVKVGGKTPEERWRSFVQFRQSQYPEMRQQIIRQAERRGDYKSEIDQDWPEQWERSRECGLLNDPEFYQEWGGAFEQVFRVSAAKQLKIPSVENFWNQFVTYRQKVFDEKKVAELKWLQANTWGNDQEREREIDRITAERWEDSAEYTMLNNPEKQHTLKQSIVNFFGLNVEQ